MACGDVPRSGTLDAMAHKKRAPTLEQKLKLARATLDAARVYLREVEAELRNERRKRTR